MTKKGVFTISIDTELAWGTFDHGGHIKYRDAYKKYRIMIPEILRLFKKYEISATWSIVGHLFLDKCSKVDGKLHPDIVRPNYSWYRSDWFDCDPGSDITKDNFWYGKDIVGMIKSASPEQEIACHSFCHLMFSDPGCSRQAAVSDLKNCLAVAKAECVALSSWTFPRNSPGHLDVLVENGFNIFRGKDDTFYNLKPSFLRKALLLLGDMFALTPPVVEPRFVLRKDLIELRGSMLFRFAYGVSRFIPKGVRLRKARKGIDRAIKEGKIFNLWFHPISFAWKTQEMLDEFEGILEYAGKKRREGKLEVFTLRRIADEHLKADKDGDNYNTEAITLHNDTTSLFKDRYVGELSSYYFDAFRYGRKKVEAALLSSLSGINNAGRVLEVGSGTGYFLGLMHKHGYNCMGIDLAEKMIKQSKALYPGIPVWRADARKMPFPDNSFDAVVSIETLRYFSDRDSFLKEIYRVVKPGGVIFITAAPFYSLHGYGIFNTACRLFRLKKNVSCFQSFDTAGSLKRRIQDAGFEQASVKGYFFGPYFVLEKPLPKLSSFLIRRLEPFNNWLEKLGIFKNVSNHLVAVARKP